MRWATRIGIAVVVLALGVGLRFVWTAKLDPSRATLVIAAVVCAVTAIYALLTYEMASSTTQSTTIMERSLRFSYAANLLFRTLNTKDPTFKDKAGLRPIDSEEYRRAIREYVEGQSQTEFVFVVVQNLGRGAATNVAVDVRYEVVDGSSANKRYSVERRASEQILRPDEAVALFVFVSKVPTSDDRVKLISARISASDYYRDAVGERPHNLEVNWETHHTESDTGCVIKVS